MSIHSLNQLPLTLRAARKSDVRTQFAALCFRIVKDKPQILLVTSRGSKRWILPKGWPMTGATPAEAAETEAWEEAGVKGRVFGLCIGLYSYLKESDDGPDLPCVACVYPVKVKSLAEDYPEAGQRKRVWVSPKKAARMVAEPELRQILRSFDPKILRGQS